MPFRYDGQKKTQANDAAQAVEQQLSAASETLYQVRCTHENQIVQA